MPSHVYVTVREDLQNTTQMYTQRKKAQLFYGGLFPEPGRVAYNAGLHEGCFYKVGQFQLCKDSLALLTRSL